MFQCCGHILACVLGVRYCSYSYFSQYLGLLSTRNILAASTPIFSGLGLRFVLEHYYLSNLYVTLSSKTRVLLGAIYCICCILLSRSRNVMARPRPQATVLYFRFRRIYIELITRVICSGPISTYYLPVPYLYGIIAVVMIPH